MNVACGQASRVDSGHVADAMGSPPEDACATRSAALAVAPRANRQTVAPGTYLLALWAPVQGTPWRAARAALGSWCPRSPRERGARGSQVGCRGVTGRARRRGVASHAWLRAFTPSLRGSWNGYARVGVRPRPMGPAKPGPEGEGERRHARARGLEGGPIGRGRRSDGLRGPQNAPTRNLMVAMRGRGGLTGSRGGDTWHLLPCLRGLGVGGLGEDQRHRLDRQVAALDQPFVVLF